jgi:N-acetylglutamate synthase-like GNAT family acetyltransferase
MSQIQKVSYETAMERFKYLYRMEHLPYEPVESAVWYCSDVSCGALVWVGKTGTVRIKGTVTAPEVRGQGHGDALLRHLVAEAVSGGAKVIEVFARNPAWYLRNGFKVTRITKWKVTVLRKTL